MTALHLTQKQYDWLLHHIDPDRVRELRGNSHMEQWDIRRTLTQIFGFGGWDLKTKSLTLVREIEYPPGAVKYRNGGTNDKTIWTVVYRAEVRLEIKNPDGTVGAIYEDAASGDSQNQPSLGDAHDQAMKTALSQGLKRCAVNLGDQFGLSLYNGGRVFPVVKGTFAPPDSAARAEATPPPADAEPVQGELAADHGNGADIDDRGAATGPAVNGDDDGHAEAALAERVTRPSRRLDVSTTAAAADELSARRSAADEAALSRRLPSTLAVPPDQQAARRVNGHAAGQLPPPADDEPVHIAGARAVQRIKEQRAAEREAERQQRQSQLVSSPAGVHPPTAPRPAPAGDPETADLVEAITRATNAEQIARLWAQSAGVRGGRTTDVRGYLANVDVVAAILGDIFAAIKVDPAVAIPVGGLVVAAGRHLDAESMSLHDHVAAETADIDPATGQAVNPPADAVAPTR